MRVTQTRAILIFVLFKMVNFAIFAEVKMITNGRILF